MTLEWNVGSYLVNEAARDLFVEGELPDGWRRQENMDVDQDGNENPTIVIVPTVEELRQSPDLSQRFGERSPLTFSSGEIDRLQDRLEGLLPTYQRFRPQFAWGLQRGMVRYNRVEGLSVGTAVTVPLTPKFDFDGTVRLGGGDRELHAWQAGGASEIGEQNLEQVGGGAADATAGRCKRKGSHGHLHSGDSEK